MPSLTSACLTTIEKSKKNKDVGEIPPSIPIWLNHHFLTLYQTTDHQKLIVGDRKMKKTY